MLKKMIDDAGGPSAFAMAHGFPVSTVGMWYRGERFPSATHQARLNECTRAKIDFSDLLNLYLTKKTEPQQPHKARRIAANLLVNNLSRLKACFVELGLSPDRLNSHGDHYIARWQKTNVTVREFRDAVQALEESGADAGDIEQLHRTIYAARRESLRRLEDE